MNSKPSLFKEISKFLSSYYYQTFVSLSRCGYELSRLSISRSSITAEDYDIIVWVTS